MAVKESTMCVQCSLRALVEGTEPQVFNETPEQHMARVHPDPEATLRERRELEARFTQMSTNKPPFPGHIH